MLTLLSIFLCSLCWDVSPFLALLSRSPIPRFAKQPPPYLPCWACLPAHFVEHVFVPTSLSSPVVLNGTCPRPALAPQTLEVQFVLSFSTYGCLIRCCNARVRRAHWRGRWLWGPAVSLIVAIPEVHATQNMRARQGLL